MRTVGSRIQYRVSTQPSAAALKSAAALQETALALAAVHTTAIRVGVYRFSSHADANAHAEAAQARAIAANVRKRTPAR
ncbi:MAG: hypothetical protein ACREVG_03065 [Burkholderiales bacterium]